MLSKNLETKRRKNEEIQKEFKKESENLDKFQKLADNR